MRCNWLLAYPGRSGERVFEGCFNTLEAAQRKADRLNTNPRCHEPRFKGACWRPVFNPPPGVPLRGPGRRKLTVPERHQLRIARGTLKMAPEMARAMGSMTKAEACRVIKQLTGKIPKEC